MSKRALLATLGLLTMVSMKAQASVCLYTINNQTESTEQTIQRIKGMIKKGEMTRAEGKSLLQSEQNLFVMAANNCIAQREYTTEIQNFINIRIAWVEAEANKL